MSLAKVQRFVLFNESEFLSRSDSFHVRGLSFLYTPLKSMDEMLLKEWQLIQINYTDDFTKNKQLKTVFCNTWEMCFIIIIIIIIITILSWNYIVFCIKRALGVENKMELHAPFSFGDCTVKWNKQKTSMCCHKQYDLIEFLLTKFIRK